MGTSARREGDHIFVEIKPTGEPTAIEEATLVDKEQIAFEENIPIPSKCHTSGRKSAGAAEFHIRRIMVQKYGCTDGCFACEVMRDKGNKGEDLGGRLRINHSITCKLRIMEEMSEIQKADASWKSTNADVLGKQSDKIIDNTATLEHAHATAQPHDIEERSGTTTRAQDPRLVERHLGSILEFHLGGVETSQMQTDKQTTKQLSQQTKVRQTDKDLPKQTSTCVDKTTERERRRGADRQTDRQTERQINKHTDKQTDRTTKQTNKPKSG